MVVLEGVLPRCGDLLVGSACPPSRRGLLLRALGAVVAADVTPCSLHAGSVRSCILRIPTVHVPDANLQVMDSLSQRAGTVSTLS